MMKLPVDSVVILDMVRQKPTDTLEFSCTILANERTFLAFLRTGLGLLAGGIGIVWFVECPIIFALGLIAIAFSVPISIWGTWRYKTTKALIVGAALAVFHERGEVWPSRRHFVTGLCRRRKHRELYGPNLFSLLQGKVDMLWWTHARIAKKPFPNKGRFIPCHYKS